jgi:transcriptional antiterminator NusG
MDMQDNQDQLKEAATAEDVEEVLDESTTDTPEGEPTVNEELQEAAELTDTSEADEEEEEEEAEQEDEPAGDEVDSEDEENQESEGDEDDSDVELAEEPIGPKMPAWTLPEALQEKKEEPEEDRTPDPFAKKVVEEEPAKDDDRVWFVVHCYSGNEDKVRHNIIQRIESMGMDDLIFDVVVPTEDEVNIKNGERQTVEKKVFPGYILVNMILTEESWYMVRNTPGVTGFVGMGNDPTPLQPEEVARILKRMESESPRINVTFRPGERVRIVDGPFEDFYGKVSEIDMERATVRVMVNFFGRETPVELDFLQVEEA